VKELEDANKDLAAKVEKLYTANGILEERLAKV